MSFHSIIYVYFFISPLKYNLCCFMYQWFWLDSCNNKNKMISATVFTYQNQSSRRWRRVRKSRCVSPSLTYMHTCVYTHTYTCFYIKPIVYVKRKNHIRHIRPGTRGVKEVHKLRLILSRDP